MERLKKYLCLLMSICVILTLFGCAADPTDVTQSSTETTQEDAAREWTPVYHRHHHGTFVNYGQPSGSYQEELNQEQIAQLLPDRPLEDVTYSGWARYLENGAVYVAAVLIEREEQIVCLYFNDERRMYSCCISLESDAPISICGDLAYRIYDIDPDGYSPGVIAETEINGVPIRVTITNTARKYGEPKPFVEEILEWLSWYGSGKPDLSVLEGSKE